MKLFGLLYCGYLEKGLSVQKKHVIKAVVKVQRQLALVLLSSSTPVRIRIAIASWMQMLPNSVGLLREVPK